MAPRISETCVAPLHSGAKRLFGAIVGRLNAFFLEESEEPADVLAEEICHVGNFAKLAIPLSKRAFRLAPKSGDRSKSQQHDLVRKKSPIPTGASQARSF